MPVELEQVAVDTGEHVVQFYEDDSQLAHTVGKYLTAAVEEGAVVMVVATAEHRRMFEADLEAAELDPVTCRQAGTLVLLDAAETLAGFLHDGRVDEEEFRRRVAPVLGEAIQTGRPVRAYGEMVALLWEAGNLQAAIELEKCWNSLIRDLPFALVCGYRSESVAGDAKAGALEQICHLHSSLQQAPVGAGHGSDSAGVRARFPAERSAPGSARHFVTDALERWGDAAALVDDARLVVTELATNAVVHAGSPFSVDVRPGAGGVRVSVHDASPVAPTLCDADSLAVSGHGLRLVEAIATDWGIELETGGKTVWAELTR
jgi:anti-sigma regulatory factor (Ser/Thr protein kinase)